MGKIIVGGLIEKNGKFLLVQEAQERCRGKWNLPAGHLDAGETILEGAKREIYEECGCSVELTSIIQIGSHLMKEEPFISILFSTKLLNEDIKFDYNEILDVKWFSYEEIINMKEELRLYEWIVGAINNYINKTEANLDIIKIIE